MRTSVLFICLVLLSCKINKIGNKESNNFSDYEKINVLEKKEYYNNNKLKSKTYIFKDSTFIREYYNYSRRIKTIIIEDSVLPMNYKYISSLSKGCVKNSEFIASERYSYNRQQNLMSWSKLLPNGVTNSYNYYPDGKLYEIENRLDGKKIGDYISFYPNNQIKLKGTYQDDYRVGLWRKYYENGTFKSEGKYVKGKDIVIWNLELDKAYKINEKGDTLDSFPEYSDWKKTEEKYDEKGFPIYLWHKDGVWKYWNDNGVLIREEIWEKGVLKENKEY